MKYMNRRKRTTVKDSDIGDILGQKYPYHIDISHGNVDPRLVGTLV